MVFTALGWFQTNQSSQLGGGGWAGGIGAKHGIEAPRRCRVAPGFVAGVGNLIAVYQVEAFGGANQRYPYTMFDDMLEIGETGIIYSLQILSTFVAVWLGAGHTNPATPSLVLQLTTIILGLQIQITVAPTSVALLLLVFVCFEQINISVYILICGYAAAGLKYILTSQVLTTFFVFGIAQGQGEGSTLGAGVGTVPTLGLPLIQVFSLKLGLFPFHSLTADLYDGIPTSLLMIIQLPLKLGVFLFVTNYVRGCGPDVGAAFGCGAGGLIPIVAVQVPTIAQQFTYTFKRFMAYSSTSYLTILSQIMISTGRVFPSLPNYLIVYIITIGVIMGAYGLAGQDLRSEPLRTPQLPLLLFLSVAGQPPFIGFWAKLALLNDLLLGECYVMGFITLLSSLILTAYYLERCSTTRGMKELSSPMAREQSTHAAVGGPTAAGVAGVQLFWSISA